MDRAWRPVHQEKTGFVWDPAFALACQNPVDARYDPLVCLAAALASLNGCPPLGEYFARVRSSSRASAGLLTVPSMRISLAVTLCPYSFSLAPLSCFSTAPLNETPANRPRERE